MPCNCLFQSACTMLSRVLLLVTAAYVTSVTFTEAAQNMMTNAKKRPLVDDTKCPLVKPMRHFNLNKVITTLILIEKQISLIIMTSLRFRVHGLYNNTTPVLKRPCLIVVCVLT